MDRAITLSAPERLMLRVRGLTLTQLWVFVAVALPVIAALQAPLRTGDSAYQIRAGQLMLQSHHVLRADPFTFTVGGHPWLNQQWGAGVLFDLVYRLGGWNALDVLRSLLVGATFLFVFLACRAAGLSMRRAAWLTLASFAVSVAGITGLLSLRPQLIGMLLFALTLWILADRARHPGRVWAIPAIAVVWANVHGSFFLAPLLIGLVWIEDRHRRRAGANRLLAVAAVSAAATLANPFGVGAWGYAFGLPFDHNIGSLTEWKPPAPGDPAGLAFFLSVAAVVVFLARRRRPAPAHTLVALGVFFVLALPAVRGVYWWALAAPVFLAPLLAETPERTRPEGVRSMNTAIAAAFLGLAVALLPWWRVAGGSRELLAAAPAGITAELRQVMHPGDRLFAPQHWASWFELTFPRNPTFVDTRAEVFPTSVWRQYARASLGRAGWDRILARWRVDVVVTSHESQRGLERVIRTDPSWRLASTDRDGSVFRHLP